MAEPIDIKKIVFDERLEDQLNWYDKKSQGAQRWYKRLRIVSLVSASVIPFLSAAATQNPWMNVLVGVLGIVITICEGIQALNQYQQNWMSYRATAEALKHEKYAYLAGIGDYAKAENPLAVLADKIESLISTEHTKWVANQQIQRNDQGTRTPPPGGGDGHP